MKPTGPLRSNPSLFATNPSVAYLFLVRLNSAQLRPPHDIWRLQTDHCAQNQMMTLVRGAALRNDAKAGFWLVSRTAISFN